MPTTNELGDSVVERLESESLAWPSNMRFRKGMSVESWLTLLGEDQPYLSEAENLENGALFLRLKNAIYEELTLRQNVTLGSAMPSWLRRLVMAFHVTEATVITFNYDTLVESCVQSLRIRGQSKDPVAVGEILDEQPPLPQVGARWGRDVWNQTFRLLKLHGSVDWWSMPDDVIGMSLARTEFRSSFGEPTTQTESTRRRELPGREPFIVPPSFGKSRYFRIPLVRELWHRAAEAISQAERVSFLGYSLPAADATVNGILRRAVGERSVKSDIVNPHPIDLVERVNQLCNCESQLYDSVNCMDDFAADVASELSRDVVNGLRSVSAEIQDKPILVVPNQSLSIWQGSVVERVTKDESSNEIVLHISQSPLPIHQSTAVQHDDQGQPIKWRGARIRDVVDLADSGSRLIVKWPDHDEIAISQTWLMRDTGVSDRWLSLQAV